MPRNSRESWNPLNKRLPRLFLLLLTAIILFHIVLLLDSFSFGEEHMRGWWREKDFSAVLKEQLITCEMDANSIVAKVYADLLKEE